METSNHKSFRTYDCPIEVKPQLHQVVSPLIHNQMDARKYHNAYDAIMI